jgi:hypothetical protein
MQWVVGGAAMAASTFALAAVVLVADRTALLGTQTNVDWAALGGGGDLVDAGSPVTSGPLTVSGAGRFAIVLGSTYSSNFLAGDSLLTMLDVTTFNYTGGTFDISISSPVSGFGTQVSPNLEGTTAFTATVYNASSAVLGSFSLNASNSFAGDGSAAFVGFNSSALDISRVVLSGLGDGAAINAVTLATASVVTPVSSPATLPLLGVAVSAALLVIARKRRPAMTAEGAAIV